MEEQGSEGVPTTSGARGVDCEDRKRFRWSGLSVGVE